MIDRQRSAVTGYWLAFVVCAAASAAPFLVTYRMPMNDLPQHAAQITLWKRYHDLCYGFDAAYFKDWFTPYLLGYSIARFFASVLSVNNALKLTAYLAVVALPLAVRGLTKRAGVDDWFSLLGFPLAFGYSFYWGFLNFIVALPIGVAFVVLAYDYSVRPSKWRGAVLTILALLLLASHALVLAFALVIAGAMHLMLWREPKRMLLTAIPYVIPVPIAILWMLRVRRLEEVTHVPPKWIETTMRPVMLFPRLLASSWDSAGAAFALVFMLIVTLSGVRMTTDRRRLIPFLLALIAYFAMPSAAFGTAFLFERFAVFCGAFAILALDPRAPVIRPALARGLLLAAIIAWFAILAARFHRFDRDARDFDRIVDALPANRRLLQLNVYPQSDAIPGVPFFHFDAYYQERKGGVIGFSFASRFPELMRYRPGFDPEVTPDLDWEPRHFRWASNDSNFDYFLVRTSLNLHDIIFREATEPVDLLQRRGLWWLYAKRRASVHRDCPPFEPDDSEARLQ